MSFEQFIGVWRLVSYEYRTEEGEIRTPFGENPKGVIMYDATGFMSVQIMSAERVTFSTEDLFVASEAEVRSAFEGLNTYYGPFTVDETTKTVTHHLEGASMPNREGAQQKRQYEFEGNRLTLRATPRLLKGEVLTGVLIWERIVGVET